MMRQFIESLKRLYLKQQIDKAKITQLCNENKITEIEKEYIFE